MANNPFQNVCSGCGHPTHSDCTASAAGDVHALAGFQEAILRRLLLSDAGRDLVEVAADALLPLLIAHPADFQALGGCQSLSCT